MKNVAFILFIFVSLHLFYTCIKLNLSMKKIEKKIEKAKTLNDCANILYEED